MIKHSHSIMDGQLCLQSHYAAVVDAHKSVEIYQLGDVDCPSCLGLMAEKHAAIAEVFRARLAALTGDHSPAVQRALCHECSEVVDVVDGKLDPHHGDTGEGCPQNGSVAQIYLHPKVAARFAELDAELAFGGSR